MGGCTSSSLPHDSAADSPERPVKRPTSLRNVRDEKRSSSSAQSGGGGHTHTLVDQERNSLSAVTQSGSGASECASANVNEHDDVEQSSSLFKQKVRGHPAASTHRNSSSFRRKSKLSSRSQSLGQRRRASGTTAAADASSAADADADGSDADATMIINGDVGRSPMSVHSDAGGGDADDAAMRSLSSKHSSSSARSRARSTLSPEKSSKPKRTPLRAAFARVRSRSRIGDSKSSNSNHSRSRARSAIIPASLVMPTDGDGSKATDRSAALAAVISPIANIDSASASASSSNGKKRSSVFNFGVRSLSRGRSRTPQPSSDNPNGRGSSYRSRTPQKSRKSGSSIRFPKRSSTHHPPSSNRHNSHSHGHSQQQERSPKFDDFSRSSQANGRSQGVESQLPWNRPKRHTRANSEVPRSNFESNASPHKSRVRKRTHKRGVSATPVGCPYASQYTDFVHVAHISPHPGPFSSGCKRDKHSNCSKCPDHMLEKCPQAEDFRMHVPGLIVQPFYSYTGAVPIRPPCETRVSTSSSLIPGVLHHSTSAPGPSSVSAQHGSSSHLSVSMSGYPPPPAAAPAAAAAAHHNGTTAAAASNRSSNHLRHVHGGRSRHPLASQSLSKSSRHHPHLFGHHRLATHHEDGTSTTLQTNKEETIISGDSVSSEFFRAPAKTTTINRSVSQQPERVHSRRVGASYFLSDGADHQRLPDVVGGFQAPPAAPLHEDDTRGSSVPHPRNTQAYRDHVMLREPLTPSDNITAFQMLVFLRNEHAAVGVTDFTNVDLSDAGGGGADVAVVGGVAGGVNGAGEEEDDDDEGDEDAGEETHTQHHNSSYVESSVDATCSQSVDARQEDVSVSYSSHQHSNYDSHHHTGARTASISPRPTAPAAPIITHLYGSSSSYPAAVGSAAATVAGERVSSYDEHEPRSHRAAAISASSRDTHSRPYYDNDGNVSSFKGSNGPYPTKNMKNGDKRKASTTDEHRIPEVVYTVDVGSDAGAAGSGSGAESDSEDDEFVTIEDDTEQKRQIMERALAARAAKAAASAEPYRTHAYASHAESDENKEVVNEQVVQSSDHHSRQNYIPPNMFFPSVLQADDDGDVGHMATAAGAGGGRVLRTHSF